jgi:hypothetical protein
VNATLGVSDTLGVNATLGVSDTLEVSDTLICVTCVAHQICFIVFLLRL